MVSCIPGVRYTEGVLEHVHRVEREEPVVLRLCLRLRPSLVFPEYTLETSFLPEHRGFPREELLYLEPNFFLFIENYKYRVKKQN